MKKFVLGALLLVMALNLCACGSGGAEEEDDLSDEIQSTVQAKAAVECMFNYADVKNVMASVTDTDDNGDGTYDVKGYVTVIDDYGDKYKGKYDAVVSISESGDARCSSFSMETPTKE